MNTVTLVAVDGSAEVVELAESVFGPEDGEILFELCSYVERDPCEGMPESVGETVH